MIIIKNVTKDKIEKAINRKIEFSYEFKSEWVNSRCEIEETDKNIDCMYYGKPTWSNKSGFLGGINFVKKGD